MRNRKISTTPVPKAGEGKRGEAGYLGYLLRQAAGAVRLRMERLLADLDVTPPQFGVLTMLSAYPGISNADVARLAVLTPQTVSVIVANLEKAGSIERRPHPIHGRIQHIDLTPQGRELLQRCKQRTKQLEAHLLTGLGEGEEAIVRKWLVGLAVETE